MPLTFEKHSSKVIIHIMKNVGPITSNNVNKSLNSLLVDFLV